VLDELAVDLGGRLRHVWIRSTGTPTSTLDVLGPGWTRFTGSSGPAAPHGADAAAGSTAPVVEHRLDAITARALGIGIDGSVLVRPDGLPVALTIGAPHPARELVGA
jgi:hypothetical protein